MSVRLAAATFAVLARRAAGPDAEAGEPEAVTPPVVWPPTTPYVGPVTAGNTWLPVASGPVAGNTARGPLVASSGPDRGFTSVPSPVGAAPSSIEPRPLGSSGPMGARTFCTRAPAGLRTGAST